MSRTKEDLMNYRLQHANATLADAKLLAETNSWNSVANRLYYACFYAVLALLARHNIDAYTHKGVKSILNQHFIKSGQIDIIWGKLYQKLFDCRSDADYEDFIYLMRKKLVIF